jgi:hypothetical protein
MTNKEKMIQPLMTRTTPGAIVPDSFPSEALFILNLGPYLTDDTQAFEGNNELMRSSQLYALAEKLEEIAEILEEVHEAQHVGTDPDPNDEELMEETWEYLNGILTTLFAEIAEKIDDLVASVNEDR